MLHVHSHEEVKHFAKSIFSTFVGLLMALGLESWHQEHHRRHLAEEALESVLQEAEFNEKALHRLATDNENVPKNLNLLIKFLESYQESKVRHRTWAPKHLALDANINHASGHLKVSAWTMALANQSVQLFPKAQAEKLAAFYEEVGRLQAFLDQPVDYSGIMSIGEHQTLADIKRHLDLQTPQGIERLIWNIRQLSTRIGLIQMWASGIEQETAVKKDRH